MKKRYRRSERPEVSFRATQDTPSAHPHLGEMRLKKVRVGARRVGAAHLLPNLLHLDPQLQTLPLHLLLIMQLNPRLVESSSPLGPYARLGIVLDSPNSANERLAFGIVGAEEDAVRLGDRVL